MSRYAYSVHHNRRFRSKMTSMHSVLFRLHANSLKNFYNFGALNPEAKFSLLVVRNSYEGCRGTENVR